MDFTFQHKNSVLFIPDGLEPEVAWGRVTHLGIGAHPDDLEFMAWNAILKGVYNDKYYFGGVTLTDGGGSSRMGLYAHIDDAQMKALRLKEQKKAAVVGEYSALAALGYTSAQVRRDMRPEVKEDLKRIIKASRLEVIFTHNLADRHRTHLAAVLLTIEALRELGKEYYPKKFYGGEVWRSLDWLPNERRCLFDVSQRPNLSCSFMGLYDSQISGGKSYHQASFGRRAANATYADAYAPDKAKLLELAMDLKPLLDNPQLAPADYLSKLIDEFKKEALASLRASG